MGNDQITQGWAVLDEILLHHPGRTNGEKVRKNRMTRDEVKVILKALFNITDELSIEVVWEHMLEVWKKADGEC